MTDLIRLVAFILLLSTLAIGQQRLLVVGGGKRPPDAMKRFVDWSGGMRSRILVITWASAEPEESFAALEKDLRNAGAGDVIHAPVRPLDENGKTVAAAEITKATGVFFSGGDQNRIMDVLADESLLKLIRERYARGTPFGGTSAGAAAMSDPMMTGDADLKLLDGAQVGIAPGIGFVPNVMFDQHFLVRQRHNRLFGLIDKNPAWLGVGIDEDSAVLITDARWMTAVGATQVFIVDGKGRRSQFIVTILRPGERYDTRKRQRAR